MIRRIMCRFGKHGQYGNVYIDGDWLRCRFCKKPLQAIERPKPLPDFNTYAQTYLDSLTDDQRLLIEPFLTHQRQTP